MPTLTLQLPNLPPVVHILKDETVTIGRMRGNTIVVDDDSVSLFHAKITRKDSAFYLKDLNSTNGTAVNGQSVVEAKLSDCDRVRFADVSGQFLLGETVAAPFPAAPFPAVAVSTSRSAPPAKRGRLATASIVTTLTAVIALGIGWKLQQADRARSNVNARPVVAATNRPAAVQPRKQSVAELARSLKASDPAERRRAATALHALGDEAKVAIPELREALKDEDKEVRVWSALTLINNRNYDPATVPILLEVLHHDNPTLREVACLSLALVPYYAQLDRDTVLPALAEVADRDNDADVRKAATSALKIVAPEIFARGNGD
jgi:pSer/pThr/pTyr-binding forkhead associated (FHA) protein